ncbi:hypothetical protein NL50_10460 [Clostridium acetobutylicum]|nr:hypothetical protein NL50_10460 [Clostridium acetobutylicum]
MIEVINSGVLSGAAYEAGKELFVAYINPMLQKLAQAVSDIEADLNAYRSADNIVRQYENHLDYAQIKRQLNNTKELICLVQQKIDDDKDYIQNFITGGFDKVGNALAELPTLYVDLENLEKVKSMYDQQLAALEHFVSSTSPLFIDSLKAFKYALQGVDLINQTRASADGTITFPVGADMSWMTNLKGEQFSSKLAGNQDKNELPMPARAKIKDIQNDSALSATQKADKIEDVYEGYLYSLAKSAFDEYDKTRLDAVKKYGKKFNESQELKDAETKLTKTLQGIPVNIKKIVIKMGNDDLEISHKGFDYAQFIDMVNTDKPLDLKSRKLASSQSGYSIWSRGWKGNPLIDNKPSQPSPDYLGNYLFGYYGQGNLTMNGEALKMGAGIAQMLSDKSVKLGNNGDNPFENYGDNPGDSKDIQDGINDYNKAHKK